MYHTISQAISDGGFEGFLDWLEQQPDTLTFVSKDSFNCPLARWFTDETESEMPYVESGYIGSATEDIVPIAGTDFNKFTRWIDRTFTGYFTVRELRQAMSQAVIPTQPWLLSPIKVN